MGQDDSNESEPMEEDSIGDCHVSGFYANYEPKETLGQGLQSVVRRCVEKRTGKEFAVKIIDLTAVSQGEEDPDDMYEAVHREIDILRDVTSHPYIIALHDVFESPTFIFLVFELCKNGELFDYLTQVVTLSEKKTRTVMRQLFEAVAFFHAKSIVHRDLKPENILLDDDFNIKLTDFGFAIYLRPNEFITELLGTPGYLAPEVLRCSMYDNAQGYQLEVDLWACGVIMYTILVGCPPFWHRRQITMLRSIMEGNYTFGPEWDDISDDARDLVSKLLVVEPLERLTAKQALAHKFFQIKSAEEEPTTLSEKVHERIAVVERRKSRKERVFHPRRMFRLGINTVRAMIRLKRLHLLPTHIDAEGIRNNPYGMKPFRKAIDGFAFKIYGHWVKKGEDQNRAALFENLHRREMKQAVDEDGMDIAEAFRWSHY